MSGNRPPPPPIRAPRQRGKRAGMKTNCWVCFHRVEQSVKCTSCIRIFHRVCAGPLYNPVNWICQECRSPALDEKFGTIPMHCWRCLGVKNEQLKCSTCIRQYHARCITIPHTKKNWSCHLCRLPPLYLKLGRPCIMPCAISLKCFAYILDTVFYLERKSYEFYPINTEYFLLYNETVQHVDLLTIWNKLVNVEYTNGQQFVNDFLLMEHNMSRFTNNQDLQHTATKLCDAVMREMDCMLKCIICFLVSKERPAGWFAKTCSRPHLLVWAMKNSSRYWPAKVMCITNGLLELRFFGGHGTELREPHRCLLYSEDDPNIRPYRAPAWVQSLKEVALHITNLERRFGRFQYAQSNTPATLQIGVHLKAMLPDRCSGDVSALVIDDITAPVGMEAAACGRVELREEAAEQHRAYIARFYSPPQFPLRAPTPLFPPELPIASSTQVQRMLSSITADHNEVLARMRRDYERQVENLRVNCITARRRVAPSTLQQFGCVACDNMWCHPNPRVEYLQPVQHETMETNEQRPPSADSSTSSIEEVVCAEGPTVRPPVPMSILTTNSDGASSSSAAIQAAAMPNLMSQSPVMPEPMIQNPVMLPASSSFGPPPLAHSSLLPASSSLGPPPLAHSSLLPASSSFGPPPLAHSSLLPASSSFGPPPLAHSSLPPASSSFGPPPLAHSSFLRSAAEPAETIYMQTPNGSQAYTATNNWPQMLQLTGTTSTVWLPTLTVDVEAVRSPLQMPLPPTINNAPTLPSDLLQPAITNSTTVSSGTAVQLPPP